MVMLLAIALVRLELTTCVLESDSDSEVGHHGNRGHKLQKGARFARQGQLAPPSGPELYREVRSPSLFRLVVLTGYHNQIVNYAGYRRAIISRNPPLIDEEGYEIDSDDDEEHILDAINNAAEFNPHANIRLESVCRQS